MDMKTHIIKCRTAALKALAILIPMMMVSCEENDPTEDQDDESAGEISVYNYWLVASGQTTLYDLDGEELGSLDPGDDLYGQDANYLRGDEMNFLDNDDGTVTDLNTGLVWQQTPSSQTFTCRRLLITAISWNWTGRMTGACPA